MADILKIVAARSCACRCVPRVAAAAAAESGCRGRRRAAVARLSPRASQTATPSLASRPPSTGGDRRSDDRRGDRRRRSVAARPASSARASPASCTTCTRRSSGRWTSAPSPIVRPRRGSSVGAYLARTDGIRADLEAVGLHPPAAPSLETACYIQVIEQAAAEDRRSCWATCSRFVAELAGGASVGWLYRRALGLGTPRRPPGRRRRRGSRPARAAPPRRHLPVIAARARCARCGRRRASSSRRARAAARPHTCTTRRSTARARCSPPPSTARAARARASFGPAEAEGAAPLAERARPRARAAASPGAGAEAAPLDADLGWPRLRLRAAPSRPTCRPPRRERVKLVAPHGDAAAGALGGAADVSAGLEQWRSEAVYDSEVAQPAG